METDNALLNSIKRRGPNSYYYAHAPRSCDSSGAQVLEGAGLVTGGPPQLVTSSSCRESPESLKLTPIRNYSWCDEDEELFIYVPCAPQASGLEVLFSTHSLELKYCAENRLHLLHIKKLRAAVAVPECKYRVRNGRITVTLKKETIEKWYSLVDSPK